MWIITAQLEETFEGDEKSDAALLKISEVHHRGYHQPEPFTPNSPHIPSCPTVSSNTYFIPFLPPQSETETDSSRSS